MGLRFGVLYTGSGGGGGTPPWDATMAVDNTTVHEVIKTDGGQPISKIFSLANGGHVSATSPSADIFGATGAGVVLNAEQGVGGWITGLFSFNFIDGGSNFTYLLFALNDRRQWVFIPNKSGQVAVGGNGNYTTVGAPGKISYDIPHGLLNFQAIPLTPTWASITAKNTDTANLLVGGYFLSYDNTNITIHLSVATVGTPAIDIDWNAIT